MSDIITLDFKLVIADDGEVEYDYQYITPENMATVFELFTTQNASSISEFLDVHRLVYDHMNEMERTLLRWYSTKGRSEEQENIDESKTQENG